MNDPECVVFRYVDSSGKTRIVAGGDGFNWLRCVAVMLAASLSTLIIVAGPPSCQRNDEITLQRVLLENKCHHE